ncbi:AraC family transcriptional regulator [Hylemonella gracilis]|uniref:AraC family transcriptional regulator n=2 Tax=Hylemonella gracilis TaxID=80880 RepID=A0A4P6UJF4_9BURK|nr:AraC family transcriptional regulator [Hylemonella gracilis]QBK04217.1 AraC family transcriptional regulator [Hylemonella gracilis]
MAFVRSIAHAYVDQGKDPMAALQAAQITPSDLARVDARVSAAQFEALNAHAMQELDDEALGWFARRLPWGSHGLLCRASITAPNLGVALKRWCRHHRLLVDDIVLHLAVDQGLASVCIEERRPGRFPAPALREFCLVSTLRFLLGYASWAIDSGLALRSVCFPYAAPAHADAYALMFPGPVHFDTPQARVTQTALCFDASYLALPLRRDEAALRVMLQRALPLTVRPYRRDRLLGQQVREALRPHGTDADHAHTAQTLALQLHLSPRTLHRQLQAEGLNLQALKDEARRGRAEDLLRRTQRSIKQVAQAAGFRNEKSFARAFRVWTGQSPSEFRRQAQELTP